jgi:DNA-binding GntR family transcriptional regulator
VGTKLKKRSTTRAMPAQRRTAARRAMVDPDGPVQQSLMQQAYDALKLAIITLEYRPGAVLVESRIREKIPYGRTPVHEAVARLALEGMLDIMPRKGIVVRPLSLDEALSNIEARLIVEPACARLAAERATADDVSEISQILARAKPMLARRDIQGLMLNDRAYHNAIARAARNPTLQTILQGLHERSLRFWFISLSDTQHLTQVDQEHREILNALTDHDGSAAENAVRAHIQSFRDTIKQTI